ncbi:MAG TPA: HNH endonuclease signature motif containing protein [Actinomycetes bacterium]|nr:HNH endonuclease signature motif containing protein [Actinomycetes bacterium]
MDQRRTDAFVDLVVGRAEPPQVNLNVTVPLDVLGGDSQAPAMVSGIGAVRSSQLSEWIDSATIRRLLTEATNGYLVDVTERQYRPSRALDRTVRLRDQVCRFPGCSRPATTSRSGTYLDHTVPWPEGETAASNPAVLCRHHHRLKHSPGWSVKLSPDGLMTWVTPIGKKFVTQPWIYSDPG